MEMDHLDKLAGSVLDGYLVRKDLVRTFSRRFPVPILMKSRKVLKSYNASCGLEP